MTPRELVKKQFRFEETEPVPYWIPYEEQIAEEIDTHYGGAEWRERVIPYVHGWHCVGGGPTEDLGDGRIRDPFGYVWRGGELMHLEEPALKEPDLSGYTWPEPENGADWKSLAESYAAIPAYRLCGVSFGFFERGSFIRGVQELLMDMVEHPQFVHDLFDGYLELRLQLIDRIIDRVPVEAIFDGGDDCDQRGPMMGLERWREFVRPRLARVVEHVHGRGLPVVAHMCGNVAPLVDDLLEMGLDGLESLQAEAMDVYALKEKVAGRMWLIGGMGVQQMMPFGTPDEVREETRRLVRELGRGGGYVLGPAKPLMRGVPVENAAAFIEVALEQ